MRTAQLTRFGHARRVRHSALRDRREVRRKRPAVSFHHATVHSGCCRLGRSSKPPSPLLRDPPAGDVRDYLGRQWHRHLAATTFTALGSALAARGEAAPSPWYFPRPEEYRKLLEAHGFEVRDISLFPRATLLPGDVGGWLETFAQPYTSALPVAERQALIAEVVEALHNVLCDASGDWKADYVRLRFAATKPTTAT